MGGARPRRAFSLVEMLVAMALVLFVMAILSEAFTAGLESFRQLKAVGDLNTRLRGAVTLLRSDLRADHFGTGKPLSQTPLSPPPAQGFFRIYQGSPAQYEGTDADGIPSYRAADAILHFSIHLTGNRPEDYLSAVLPSGSPLAGYGPAAFQNGSNYSSQWAEVAYFLQPNGSSAAGTPLYALYRHQLLVFVQGSLPDLNSLGSVPAGLLSQYQGVSCQQDPLAASLIHFNTPADLTIPQRRFGMNAAPLSAGMPMTGLGGTTYPTAGASGLGAADLVLTDVISFHVQIFAPSVDGTQFVDVPLGNNPVYGALGARVFDTWSQANVPPYDFSNWLPGLVPTSTTIPLNVQIQALQVNIRVWDQRTQRTRQVTLVQPM